MRVWSFSSCEYDEEERRLWVRGKPAKLGDRVLDVLEALLKAPDYQSTSVHLSRIWGPSGSIDSVKDAIRQLRRAIEQGGIPDEIIATVRGTGFQIAARVIERTFEPSELWRSLIKDAPAPGLPGWRLQLPLEPGTRARVWQIGNERNHQVRVVKYATDPARRAALRREDRSWEAFERGLTSQKCFVRIFSSHLTSRPCYLEMEYGGLTLLAWSDSQRTEGGLPRELCLQIMADLAYAVAAVHSLGIVHNDLKPANVLISPSLDQGGRWQVKITDFGVASVVKENRLAELQLDDSTLQPAAAGLGGTTLYHAPEIGPNTPPLLSADVYALGVILFQILCGDYQKTPYPGWERQIADPVLQQDIEAACNVDPARRPQASELAEWLRTVDARRQKLHAAQAFRDRTAHDQQQLTLLRARRPWVIAAIVLLLVGVCTSLLLYRRTIRQRDLAEAINTFLAEDFLMRTNPYKTGSNTESLVETVKQASPSIDRRFAAEPLIAARLHHTIAQALDKRMDYPDADKEYQQAAALYREAEGADSASAVITEMQRTAMHVRDTTPGSLDQAKAIFQSQQEILDRTGQKSPEVPIWADYAQGLIEMYSSDAQHARLTFQAGLRAAQMLPRFNPGVILMMQQLLAVSETRMGEGGKAEALIKEMMVTVKRLHYTDKPNLANLGINLAQAYLSEQKNQETINTVDQFYPAIVLQMGEANPLSLTALGVRAQAERNLGRWDDATRDSLSVYRNGGGKSAYMESGSLSDAALYQCQGGHYLEGEQNARRAFTIGKKLAAENPGIKGSFTFSLATCLVGLGQYQDADKLLKQLNPQAMSQIYMDEDWSVDYELTKAEIAFHEKAYASVRKDLAMARPACMRPAAAPYRLAWFNRITDQMDRSADSGGMSSASSAPFRFASDRAHNVWR
jgi:serine/threonine protein kinase/DNA-binding winged helix-turn-helix (wHTH) protein